jgi:DNA polymerase III subunit epsilon
MTGWADGPLLGFDTETTGLRTATDRIVSAALVRRGGRGVRTRAWLLNPGAEIPAAATAVHGITTDRARSLGADPRTALAEIAHHLTAALAAGIPVVAFNASFDLAVLDAELRRHALPTMASRLGREISPVLDPLLLDRALDPERPGTRRLADLCEHYGVSPDRAFHTAEVDAIATLDVLRAQARRFPATATMPPEQLHAWQVTAHRAWSAERADRRRRSGQCRE